MWLNLSWYVAKPLPEIIFFGFFFNLTSVVSKANDQIVFAIVKYSKNLSDEYKESLFKHSVFELTSFQNLNLEQTLIPIFKRKIMNYIFQTTQKKMLESNGEPQV